jgi:hypothetical protein
MGNARRALPRGSAMRSSRAAGLPLERPGRPRRRGCVGGRAATSQAARRPAREHARGRERLPRAISRAARRGCAGPGERANAGGRAAAGASPERMEEVLGRRGEIEELRKRRSPGSRIEDVANASGRRGVAPAPERDAGHAPPPEGNEHARAGADAPGEIGPDAVGEAPLDGREHGHVAEPGGEAGSPRRHGSMSSVHCGKDRAGTGQAARLRARCSCASSAGP